MLKMREAFSLMEIMIVVAIALVLLSLIGPMAVRAFGKTQVMATKSILNQIKDGLQQYRMDVGNFPKQEQGLRVLVEAPTNQRLAPKWDGPYIDMKNFDDETGAVVDKWGNEIIYNNPPQKHGDKYRYFELISLGANGEEGGTGNDAELDEGA